MLKVTINNPGGLTKPISTLIEKIADAVGVVYLPTHLVRVAKAEVETTYIQAEGEIKVDELHQRTLNRLLLEESKKQKNMEDITRQALPNVTDEATPEDIEDDWITNFFDKCRLISDSEMQQLWSRILAGEANLPGTFSKRTVNFLSSLDKNEAESFSDLCKSCCKIDNQIYPLVFDLTNPLYENKKIDFESLTNLESIGLIKFDYQSSFQVTQLPKTHLVKLGSTVLTLHFKNEKDNTLQLGKVLLTQLGKELATICKVSTDDEFLKYITDRWIELGYIE